jgi:hypothetical protein
MRDAEVSERSVAVGRIRRPCWQRQSVTVTQRCTQDCVHKSACARLARRSRQIDGIVDDRRSRNTSQVEELIQTQAEDCDHLIIKFRDLAPREVFDEVIETSLPSQRTSNNLRGE